MKTVRVSPHRRLTKRQEETLLRLAWKKRQPLTDRELRTHYLRDLSRLDKRVLGRLIEQVKAHERSGFTYTGLFKFDVDDRSQMEAVYDRLGHRVMYAVASTNRRLEDFDVDEAVVGKTHGIALWRDERNNVYADEVSLFVGIDDEEALSRARERGQFAILKIDGRTRSFAFLEVPGFDVTIRGEGAERTFEKRPEGSRVGFK